MKLRNNNAGIPALTPTPPISGLLTHDELTSTRKALRMANVEIANLRKILRSERVTHGKLENALGRYQAVLEATLAEQATGLHELRLALLPQLKVGPRE